MTKVIKKVFSVTPIATVYVFIYHITSGFFVAAKLYASMHIIQSGYEYIKNFSDINVFIKYGVMLLIIIALERLLEYLYAIAMNGYLFEKTGSYLNREMAAKLSRVDLINFEDRDFLTIEERAATAVDDERLSNSVRLLAMALGQVLEVILILATLWTYSPYLVALAVLTVVPYLITRLIRGKAFYDLKSIEAFDERKLNYFYSIFTDTKTNREIKSYNSSEFFLSKYTKVFKDTSKKYFDERLKDAKSLLFCDILSVIAFSIAIVITVKLAFDGKILIGMMGAALMAYQNMQNSSKEMIVTVGNLPRNISFASDYFTFMDSSEEKKAYNVDFGKISVKDASFTYPKTDNGLHDISLSIDEGESVAIVGYNGSGKTTFTKALTGVYDASGEISFAGVNIKVRGLSFDDYTIVPQERTETNLSIAEHIASQETYDEARIKSLLDYVSLDKLYKEHSLDTRLGKDFDGVELSGGERQRLDIARSMYKDAKLIILDEATSALDPMQESEILKKFLDISKGRTSIIVTHRLGICKSVDKIVVFKDGRVDNLGTHDELLKNSPYYREMYEAQAKFYK
ncbi:ABC transporter ATP-binding protein [Fenollaria timonensis]|uniref:ABC transporter ATP-binding protein n=1 Tax=Fenollaria timonensis TaxID=1723384 RepID=UPI00071D17F7|nr:ABC transporter ATP-binding protein [Fenollaria timonensis]